MVTGCLDTEATVSQRNIWIQRCIIVFNGKSAIALLGPTQGQTADETVRLARDIGYELASKGYTTVLQQGAGIIPVAAEGVKSAKGTLVMVTQGNKDDAPQKGAHSIIETQSPLQCAEAVLNMADAIIVLPGDLTALAVVTQIWSFGHTKQGAFRQIILTGESWPDTIKALGKAAHLDPKDFALLSYATSAKESIEKLRYYVQPSTD
jgi:predicted Rossmann-fold nucleotide-binding protein